MRVLICASEMVPFAKTGGLADVVGALSLALEKLGVEVRVVLPKYRTVAGHQPEGSACLPDRQGLASDSQSHRSQVTPPASGQAGLGKDIEVTKIGKNVQVYLIKNDTYFNRDGLYGEGAGDYPDNLERFSFYCRRALDLLKEINFQPDIIHCHDWQAALIPVYLKNIYAKDNFYKNIKTLLTIHNLAYQGLFAKVEYPKLGLDWALFGIEGLEFYDKINILKGGICFSDLLNTVSPAYAKEIQSKKLGCGLEGVLSKRKKDLCGIINGLDYESWDPAKDKYIYKRYSPEKLEDKYVNKKRLQEECRLAVERSVPLFGIVGRLAEQKGLDLIAGSMDYLIKHSSFQLVALGTGDIKYRNMLEGMQRKYPHNLSAHIKFDDSLAHKIYAGCDIFLMPSRYEPCGLGQMISLKYGTIPLVFKTGGLADTVSPENGFVFDAYLAKDFVETVKNAIRAYKNKAQWLRLVRKAFTYDFSWEKSAKKYVELYGRLKKSG